MGRFPRIGAFHTWIHLSWHLFAPRCFTFPILWNEQKKYWGRGRRGESQVWHPLCAQMSPLKEFSVISKKKNFWSSSEEGWLPPLESRHVLGGRRRFAVDYLSQPSPIVKFTQNTHAWGRMQGWRRGRGCSVAVAFGLPIPPTTKKNWDPKWRPPRCQSGTILFCV